MMQVGERRTTMIYKSRDGSPCIKPVTGSHNTRYGRKADYIIGFVDRSYNGPMPVPGENWSVEITGFNPKRTVMFFRPLEKRDLEKSYRVGYWIERTIVTLKMEGVSPKLDHNIFRCPVQRAIGDIARRWLEEDKFDMVKKDGFLEPSNWPDFMTEVKAALDL